jgi:Fe2+ transport system protein FeoA
MLDSKIDNEYQDHKMANLAVTSFHIEAPTVVSLAEIPTGRRARVAAVLEPGALGERLMELGLTAGTEVEVIRRGLFGDPLQVRLRGFMLSLRRRQARAIRVQPLTAR